MVMSHTLPVYIRRRIPLIMEIIDGNRKRFKENIDRDTFINKISHYSAVDFLQDVLMLDFEPVYKIMDEVVNACKYIMVNMMDKRYNEN